MRVLMWVDASHGSIPGGHVVQMQKTYEALRRLGVDVHLVRGSDVSLEGVDIVHCMGAQRADIRRARLARIPVVVSTIYCNVDYTLGMGARASVSRPRRAEHLSRYMVSVVRHGAAERAREFVAPLVEQQMLFEMADLLLPNSELEARAIQLELGVSTPHQVVPNAADTEGFRLPEAGTPRQGVVYVGRIDPHKNQLGLIKALAGSGLPLTIVGDVHPHHQAYERRCRDRADSTVRFVPARDQDCLRELYQRAEVHAMPSWFETTGLSSLEAALCGAAVVTTSRGYASEYFGDLAEYCDPAVPATILSAVQRARAAGPNAALRERIIGRFTWEHTATATVAAYNRLLVNSR